MSREQTTREALASFPDGDEFKEALIAFFSVNPEDLTAEQVDEHIAVCERVRDAVAAELARREAER